MIKYLFLFYNSIITSELLLNYKTKIKYLSVVFILKITIFIIMIITVIIIIIIIIVIVMIE